MDERCGIGGGQQYHNGQQSDKNNRRQSGFVFLWDNFHGVFCAASKVNNSCVCISLRRCATCNSQRHAVTPLRTSGFISDEITLGSNITGRLAVPTCLCTSLESNV